MYKRQVKEFKNWLLETAAMPLNEQVKTIEDKLLRFMKGYEQTDDITLAVIEIWVIMREWWSSLSELLYEAIAE